MKLKSMTSVITKSAMVLAACASLNAFAGTAPSGKAPMAPAPEEPGALFDTIGATLEVGYDTRYFFRGLYFADNTVWAGLSLSVPLTEQLTWGIGALYTNSVESTTQFGAPGDFSFAYQELDLSTSLTYDAGFAKFGLVYTYYNFFNGFSGNGFPAGVVGPAVGAGETNISNTNELGITVAAPLGPVNIYTGWFYDFNIGGSYFELGVDYPIEITSWLSLVPAIKTGYGLDYYSSNGNPILPFAGANGLGFGATGVSSGFTHILYSLSAPIKLTKSATLTPYIALNSSGSARFINTNNNEVFGGVKLGVTF